MVVKRWWVMMVGECARWWEMAHLANEELEGVEDT